MTETDLVIVQTVAAAFVAVILTLLAIKPFDRLMDRAFPAPIIPTCFRAAEVAD